MASRMVRKSAYGRTQLFLPTASCVIREVKCMGGITRHTTANVYHVLKTAHETESACWHCCEPIEDDKWVPLPRLYDPAEEIYHVFGKTCSPSCAKAYILEHTTFDRGQHLNVLVKMLRDVYGVTEQVIETPPRPALRRFGGVFDPRKQQRVSCRLVEPPFVSYCMVVEERAGGNAIAETEGGATKPIGGATHAHAASATSDQAIPAVEEAYNLDEPPPPGLYTDFVRHRQQATSSGAAAIQRTSTPNAATKRRRDVSVDAQQASAANRTGPLSKFIKRT